MRKSLTSFSLLLGLVGCLPADSQTSGPHKPAIDSFRSHNAPFFYEHENDESFAVDSSLRDRLNWIDGLTAGYIDASEDPSIQQALSDSTMQWTWDRLLHTDTAAFVVIRVGHDEFNGDGKIFATDRWLYVDTLSRSMYEYDVPNDSLIRWTGR
ncbi:hypothetical protein [uncultured Chitinophaga sp.]|jgi:hypothetical protein|uniref:hypothetical protein n=1 Tax=uncultured Chitinophaga sp. TaxID=339340 RepID=UPI00261E54B6|nr:hypothetical protein [uncultured Chitinophaga sp.]